MTTEWITINYINYEKDGNYYHRDDSEGDSEITTEQLYKIYKSKP